MSKFVKYCKLVIFKENVVNISDFVFFPFRTLSELKYENTKWKDRALRLKEKEKASSGHQCENIPCTLTPSLEESITPYSFPECTPVPQKTEISTALFPPEVKTGAQTDETSLTSEKMRPVDSSKVSSFGTESKWQLPSSKIFDNSQLGFPAGKCLHLMVEMELQVF